MVLPGGPDAGEPSMGSHHSQCREEVVVEAHEVDLAHCCQRLLLRQLLGAGRETQALCTRPHSTAANYDHLVAVCMQVTHHLAQTSKVAEVEGILLQAY